MNQGKVVSVYLNTTTATYSVPPTISLSAGTATIAWPANCWPAATANIGSNGQLLSFTVTNAGYGYVAAPTVGVGTVSGTAAGGTFTTAATAPTARIALYNVTIANFTPVTTVAVQNDATIFPPNRKINSLSLSTGGLGLNLANNLTLIGTAPLTLTASPNGTGNILNLNGNTLTCTWNGYAGTTSTFGASNAYLQNGSMAIFGRGGGAVGSTYNFPFSATFTAFTGNGSTGVSGGSDITKITVTETGAPSNALTTGTGLAFGNRAFRLQANSFQSNPGISGINPTVTLRFNSQDGLTSTQDQTFVNQAPALSGAWNVVSAAYGVSGALPATGLITTPTVAPGPIALDGDDFFAWGTNAPTISNVSPLTLCAGSGQFTITGTNLNGVTSVLINGTPVANFTIISPTQIDAFAGVGTSPKPLGVAGQIIPWNFPLLMLAWKVAPALAAGNTVVLKPAETTSLTALLFAEVCQQAELPAGVVNIVTGDGSTGALIVNHPGIDKIAFTGSTEVGKIIARAVAPTNKSVTLELGGKAANIIFEDAAIDESVEGIVNGIFFNQGHVCCAGSRLILQESIADEVIEKLKNRMAKIRVGDPMDKNTDLGAINSKEQLLKIRELSAAGDSEGAERWSAPCDLPGKGFWFAPTIFTGVTQAHRIAREEIFGPVLSVLTFRTPQEAIDKANNTPFGLSAGIWSEKGSKVLWASQQLRAGVIWANTFNKFDPTSPFGGYKESGWGREGGRHGLSAYLKGVSHE